MHSRSVAAILKLHNAQLTASTTNDLSDANIRTRLKLGDSQIPRRSTSTSQKRASRRQSVQSPTSPTTAMPQTPTSPTTTSMPQSEFVDANESLPSVVTQETLDDQNKLQQQQLEAEAAAAKEQDELNRKKEEDRAVAAAVAAERESKRIAAEREVAAKKAEEDKIQREQMEQVRVQEEKKLFQQRIMEAEKNKDVVLSGYVSVQPHTSPVSNLINEK